MHAIAAVLRKELRVLLRSHKVSWPLVFVLTASAAFIRQSFVRLNVILFHTCIGGTS